MTGDSVFGSSRALRRWLEEQRQPFVLAVPSSESLWARLYDWALTPRWRLQLTGEERAWSHALLIRRSRKDPNEEACYVVFAPREEVSLGSVAGVARTRWRIEEGFEQAEGHLRTRRVRGSKIRGLASAHYPIASGSRVPCGRCRKGAEKRDPADYRTLHWTLEDGVGELIPLTVPEAQRLMERLLMERLLMERLLWKKAPRATAVIHGSLWRRHHQYQA